MTAMGLARPPRGRDQRANGLLVIEVGVAVLYPAEFVGFEIRHRSVLLN